MMIIKKVLELDRFDYFSTHLRIINPVLPIQLTPKEIEMLANFMSLEGSIAEDRFGTTGRKIIKEKMGIGNAGVSNYMKSLKQKSFITEDNEIRPILFPGNEQQLYQFKLINKNA